MFVNRSDGKPTGDAFVMFGTDETGRRALAKHRERIGTRYIELFRTTQAEVQQIFSRHQQQRNMNVSGKGFFNTVYTILGNN